MNSFGFLIERGVGAVLEYDQAPIRYRVGDMLGGRERSVAVEPPDTDEGRDGDRLEHVTPVDDTVILEHAGPGQGWGEHRVAHHLFHLLGWGSGEEQVGDHLTHDRFVVVEDQVLEGDGVHHVPPFPVLPLRHARRDSDQHQSAQTMGAEQLPVGEGDAGRSRMGDQGDITQFERVEQLTQVGRLSPHPQPTNHLLGLSLGAGIEDDYAVARS